MSLFGSRLKNPKIWTFNRDTVSAGIGIGLFCAYLPMPFQMLPAVFAVILLRANLPFAILTVWITNPLTWVPLFAPAYRLGAWMLGVEPLGLSDLDLANLMQPENVRLIGRVDQVVEFLAALWLGSLIIGSVLSGSAYLLTRFAWRAHVIMRWRARRQRRQLARAAAKSA